VRDARDKFQRELDRCGVAMLESAADALAHRQQIEAEIKTITARTDALGGGTIEKEFATAQTECADADVARRAVLVENAPAPATLEGARALAGRTAQQLREAEQHEAAARAKRKAAAERLCESSERIETHRQIFQKKKEEATDLTAQLKEMERAHGADDARAAKLVTLAAVRTEAQKRLDNTRRAIIELKPELLDRDRERLSRAISHYAAAQRDAEEKRATARGQFQRDGATDPQAEFALAHERLRDASERAAHEQRHAEAVGLLHKLFLAEQKSLSERFTRPLAAKISGYLACLFGPGARAELTLQGGNFQGLRLIRSEYGGGVFQFENLSGGTREQLAAAVRLALAEVLAETHDGCLPVVFDDAFAYSDPERVQELQRMLDLAANRGLQIIVLTCNPADYADLRPKHITLDAQ
jgi:DNA repair exonuclease SbcCD ATPase subunit